VPEKTIRSEAKLNCFILTLSIALPLFESISIYNADEIIIEGARSPSLEWLIALLSFKGIDDLVKLTTLCYLGYAMVTIRSELLKER
jgi:hypothetical protein